MSPSARAGTHHPVKAELLRLLGGSAACVALLLLIYVIMDSRLERMRRIQERFHDPALRLNDELSTAMASMTMPPGMSISAAQAVESEVVFVAAVNRDFSRAQSLLKALVELHEREKHLDFRQALVRLRRAADELQGIERKHQGSPLELARFVSTQPLYASVVVQQTRRLHEPVGRRLRLEQDETRRLFIGIFAATCVVLAVGLGVQLRRSLRGIDAILAQERDARDGMGALLAALPDLWFQLDDRGRFTDVSDESHSSLDVPWAALRGEAFRLAPAGKDGADAVPAWTDRREPRTLEYEVPADGYGPRVYEARLVPTSRGHWLYLSRDISERARESRALAHSKEELERQVALRTQQLTIARDVAEQANRAKSEFLSRMSHELRTPMNAVLGFAQLMSMNPEITQAQRQSVDHILRAGKHLLHLINEVLDLAHVESGRLTLSPEPLGLRDLTQEVIILMQPLAEANRVRIEMAVGSDVVVRGDRLRVKQILLNLVSNAVKYNRPGGWVRLKAQTISDGRVLIAVEDSGQGISEAGRQRLFEPFVRLGEDPQAVEGTGIGLSICKRLVELMDGRIGVESRIGDGSSFWVELPSDHRVPPPPPTTVHGGPRDGETPPATVLYVEDNPSNQELVAQIVERHPSVKLVTASSVAQGLDLAQVHRPDLIFIDLHLGDGTGYQLLNRLQLDPRTRSIPAVALTANAMPLESVRAREAGFSDFVTKPIDVARFDTLLGSMLGRSGAAAD